MSFKTTFQWTNLKCSLVVAKLKFTSKFLLFQDHIFHNQDVRDFIPTPCGPHDKCFVKDTSCSRGHCLVPHKTQIQMNPCHEFDFVPVAPMDPAKNAKGPKQPHSPQQRHLFGGQVQGPQGGQGPQQQLL
ncbi:hypothetical protein ACLKA6_014056 [Drosophila palustris]